MRRILTIILCLFVFGVSAEDSLPAPPSGFSWQRLSPIKSYLLKPAAWHFKETKKGQTDAFFITKEDVDKSGPFLTGLTLNCLRYLPKQTGKLPSEYAAAFADAVAAKHSLIDRTSFTQGPFRSLRFRYVDTPIGKESTTCSHLLIANDKTGTLFLVIFEAPTKDWDDAWKTGEVLFKRMLLDDEI